MISIIIFIIFAILLGVSISSIPLIIPVLVFAAVSFKTKEIYVLSFFSGLILDLLTFNPLGFSSAFFLSLVFIIYLYQKKFEIDNIVFVSAISSISSFIYLWILGNSYSVFSSVFILLVAGVSFLVYKLTTHKKTFSYR